MTEHFIEVKWHAGWSEYRPDCQCGWTGSYTTDKRDAELEGASHCGCCTGLGG